MADLAVGVHPDGADAWALQDVLATGVSAGAPPDEYNQLGQDWSQPPWRPDQLEELEYQPFRALIGAVLLYYLSVGPVRGFALLLGISTVVDIIASWFFIRPAVLILARSPRLRARNAVFGMPHMEDAQ